MLALRMALRVSLLAVLLSAHGCAHGRTDGAPRASSTEGEVGDPGEGDEPPIAPSSLSPQSAQGRLALLSEADRELGAMRASTYTHATHVDEARGVYEYDCSGFLTYALARSVPGALAAVQATTPRRPRSAEYVAFFESLPTAAERAPWQRLARVEELQPGDVIVWLKPPESRSTNTGHTLIVHGPPRRAPDAPGAFVVPIIDSTARPHGTRDARAAGDRTGLGLGEIVLFTGSSGEPISFAWSSEAREHATTIALGRAR